MIAQIRIKVVHKYVNKLNVFLERKELLKINHLNNGKLLFRRINIIIDIFKRILNYYKDPSTYIRKIYFNYKIINGFRRERYKLLSIESNRMIKPSMVKNIFDVKY